MYLYSQVNTTTPLERSVNVEDKRHGGDMENHAVAVQS